MNRQRTGAGQDGVPWKEIGVALLFVLGSLAIGFISGTAGNGRSPWFEALEKPPFQPPSWLFGPVWTVLYILMGIAAFLVWREGWHRTEVKQTLGLFAAQLTLNFAWTPVFFALQSPPGGLVVIVVLLVVLIMTTVAFLRIRRSAGYLLFPYVAWVAFATVLNASILALN